MYESVSYKLSFDLRIYKKVIKGSKVLLLYGKLLQ